LYQYIVYTSLFVPRTQNLFSICGVLSGYPKLVATGRHRSPPVATGIMIRALVLSLYGVCARACGFVFVCVSLSIVRVSLSLSPYCVCVCVCVCVFIRGVPELVADMMMRALALFSLSAYMYVYMYMCTHTLTRAHMYTRITYI
jgi:hypothetical protein